MTSFAFQNEMILNSVNYVDYEYCKEWEYSWVEVWFIEKNEIQLTL
jgi:hypothetical protein